MYFIVIQIIQIFPFSHFDWHRTTINDDTRMTIFDTLSFRKSNLERPTRTALFINAAAAIIVGCVECQILAEAHD